MKVVLVYRPPRRGAHSIEALFATISAELEKSVELVTYRTRGRWLTALDVWRLRQLRADVYHVTGDVNYLACLMPRGTSVLTVHDIGNYLYGLDGLKKWLFRLLWLELPMGVASAVTAVSDKTRDDIAAHLAVNPRVRVVRNCYNPAFTFVPNTFDAERPTILQVGTQPYKNVPRLVRALRGVPCRLWIVGRLDEETSALLETHGVEFDNFVDLPFEELVEKYRACDMVTFASTGEGFGLPIIEAQAVGRPLVTSNVSPLCDVAGDGACLVDPLDVTSIRGGILRMIEDQTYREAVVAHGLDNAAQFSASAVAGAYLGVYKSLMRQDESKEELCSNP